VRCGCGRGVGLVDPGAGAGAGAGIVTVTVVDTGVCGCGARSVSRVSTLWAAAIVVNSFRTAVKLAPALLATAQDATLLLKLVDVDRGKGGGAVVLSRVVVDFVDGHGGVDDLGLDDLLLDDRLDGLVNVVVHVLALDDRSTALGVLGLVDDALVPQLRLLGLESALGLLMVTVVELAVDNAANVVLVLLGENLAVMDGLDLAVVVVLVNLLVDGGGDLLVSSGLNRLVLDCRSDLLVDSGVVMAGLGHEVLDCLLGLVHFDVLIRLW